MKSPGHSFLICCSIMRMCFCSRLQSSSTLQHLLNICKCNKIQTLTSTLYSRWKNCSIPRRSFSNGQDFLKHQMSCVNIQTSDSVCVHFSKSGHTVFPQNLPLVALIKLKYCRKVWFGHRAASRTSHRSEQVCYGIPAGCHEVVRW